MEKRDLNISFYKAGGTLATRLNIPIPWIKKMGITQNERGIELIFDTKKNCLLIYKKDKQ